MVREDKSPKGAAGDVMDDTDPWLVGDVSSKSMWDSTPLAGQAGLRPDVTDVPQQSQAMPDRHELPMPEPQVVARQRDEAFLERDARDGHGIVRVILEDAGLESDDDTILGVSPGSLAASMVLAAAMGAATAFMVHTLVG